METVGKIDYVIGPGEVKSFSSPVTISCLDLGECVGLFLLDQRKGLAGGALINVLDSMEVGPNGSTDSVKEMIHKLLEQLKQRGSDLRALRAKVAGGALLHSSPPSTGSKNVESVINYLIEERIFLAAMDVGGTQIRTAKFDAESGMLLVRHSGNSFYKVF